MTRINFEELAKMTAQGLYRGTAIVFLGAGASMGDDSERKSDKGVPGSASLVKGLARENGIKLRYDGDGNLLDTLRPIASLAAEKQDEISTKKYVIDQIRPRCGVPLKAHRALASVDPHTVITTNYDDLYESAYREAGKLLETVVKSEQLPNIPQDSPRLLKLHGDLNAPQDIVLTQDDYGKWQTESRGLGLKFEVVAALQKSRCIFVGYGVVDENLHDILNIIEHNLAGIPLKHFALVHEVDDRLAAQWKGKVEFVAGDATEFFELVAEEYRNLGPTPFNLVAVRAEFERQLSSGDLSQAGDTCEQLAEHLKNRDDLASAGSVWRSFGEAARGAENHPFAAAALMRAGELFLEADEAYEADPVLAAAFSEATAGGAPALEQQIHPLLQRARFSTGDYHAVLRDTKQALDTYGEGASASLLYSLHATRAAAREATGSSEEAREELEAVLRKLPAEALYYRVRTGADLARLLADEFNWESAHTVLNKLFVEVSNARDDHEHGERSRLEAILKLVRANVHFAEGKDVDASTHYRECAPVLEEFGEVGFAVSALHGVIACASSLGYIVGYETRARLRDLARSSNEHGRCNNLQQKGIEYLARDSLAGARDFLIRAEALANALHSPTKTRNVRRWLGDVLLKAEHSTEALLQYAEVGDRKKVERVARSLRKQVPLEDRESDPRVDRLLELATSGPTYSQGPAFAGLSELWDVIPNEHLSEISNQLERLPYMLSNATSERNTLSDAAELIRLLAPRFSAEQARKVGAAVVSTIQRDDIFWTSHKEACRALANLVGAQAGVLHTLNIPVDRLANLAEADKGNDMRQALNALANVAFSGHIESRRKVLELLEKADPFTRVSWRQILGETTEEELTGAIRLLLPQSVNRVEKTKDGWQSIGMGGFNPRFLENWKLPSEVESEVADTLLKAVADPTVALTDRRAAALVLGRKATELNDEDCWKIAEVLLDVLKKPFEAHPMLGSTTDPLSMLRMNVGSADEVTATLAWALLAFSRWVENDEDRGLLRKEIERLRASQAEEPGVGLAEGLVNFQPTGDEEERWLHTRLLLLLNSQHPRVRQAAARSLASLVQGGGLSLDSELLDTILHLSASDDIADRGTAARVLTAVGREPVENETRVKDTLHKLRDDPSYLVRRETIDVSKVG